jgi:hypothetical protein
MECSRLAELVGRSWGQSHNSNVLAGGKKVSREDAKARKVGDNPSSAVTQDVL